MSKFKRITFGSTVMRGTITGLMTTGCSEEDLREALKERLRRGQRQKAAAEIDALRDKRSALDDDIDVVEMLRKDRARNDE